MKTVLCTFLFLTVVTLARSQYGIPDDDDVPAPSPVVPAMIRATPAPSPVMPAMIRATPAPSPVMPAMIRANPAPSPVMPAMTKATLPAPRLEVRREEYSAPITVVRTPEVKPTRFVIRKESLGYEAPLVLVRTTERPVLAYPAVKKIEIKESLPSYTPSIRVTPAVVKADYSYSTALKKDFVPIVKYFLEDDNRGSYRLETISGDGITSSSSGHLKDLGDKEGPVQVMSGYYSYTGDDGKLYTVNWTADENGYQASGEHLPKPVAPLH